MTSLRFSENIDKLYTLTRTTNFKELSAQLGVTPQAIYDARKRGIIPERWFVIAKYVSQNSSNDDGSNPLIQVSDDEGKLIANKLFEKIFEELTNERKESREVNKRLRELSDEKSALLKENADLRVENAILKTKLEKNKK